jgi:5-methylcytosine-specific restriction endonuclease McrA
MSDISSHHKRKALKISTDDGTINKKSLESLLIKQNNKCYYCECVLVEKHLDHYIPLSKGGANSIYNVVWSCPSCNLKKGAKDPIEFANNIGKLF